MNIYSPSDVYRIKTGMYLWDDPIFTWGRRRFEHTLSPGGNVSCTVIRIPFKHKLTLALLTGLQSSERHPVRHSVDHLSLKPAVSQQRCVQRKILHRWVFLTLDSPEGTSWPFAISSSFMSLVEQCFLSLSLIPQISWLWFCSKDTFNLWSTKKTKIIL